MQLGPGATELFLMFCVLSFPCTQWLTVQVTLSTNFCEDCDFLNFSLFCWWMNGKFPLRHTCCLREDSPGRILNDVFLNNVGFSWDKHSGTCIFTFTLFLIQYQYRVPGPPHSSHRFTGILSNLEYVFKWNFYLQLILYLSPYEGFLWFFLPSSPVTLCV